MNTIQLNFNYPRPLVKQQLQARKLSTFIWTAKKTLASFSSGDFKKDNESFAKERQKNLEEKRLKNHVYSSAKIRVFGVGGAGNNVLLRFIKDKKIFNKNVQYVAINTDEIALKPFRKICQTVLLGDRGLGSGSNRKQSELWAQAKKNELTDLIKGNDLIILVAAVGKGTGSGATPIIAKFARELNVPVVSLVFYPNKKFISTNKISEFDDALNQIKYYSNSYSVFQNTFFYIKNYTESESFKLANHFMISGLEGIINLAGRLYDNIDSKDFINYLCDKNQFCCFSLSVKPGKIDDLCDRLNKVVRIYDVKKENLKKFIIFSDYGISKVTNQTSAKIAEEIQKFIGDSPNVEHNDMQFAGYCDNVRKDIRINIIMSQPQKVNHNQHSVVKPKIENSLTHNHLQDARRVETNYIAQAKLQNVAKANILKTTNKANNNHREIGIDERFDSNNTNDFLFQSITRMFSHSKTHSIDRNGKKN